jgi:hypothetical protein
LDLLMVRCSIGFWKGALISFHKVHLLLFELLFFLVNLSQGCEKLRKYGNITILSDAGKVLQGRKCGKCYGWIIILIINSSNYWKVWHQFECTSIMTVRHLPVFWCRYFFPHLSFSTKGFLQIHTTHLLTHSYIRFTPWTPLSINSQPRCFVLFLETEA